MLQPLPPGFPTPDPRDPEPIARELGRASAMWMRGAYADAARKVEEAAKVAKGEHAKDSARIDAARVASLLRVSAALSTLVEEMTTRGTTDPSSIPISLEIDTADLTESELVAVQSMEVASTDVESVHLDEVALTAARSAPPAPPPRPIKTPRTLATTMQQVSRPTIPDAPRIAMAGEPNIESAHTIDLRRTLPQGVRDPRVPKPTPRPFPRVSTDPPAAEAAGEPIEPLFSDPFKDLDVPSSDLVGPATTNPVPFGAKYPPSEAAQSGETTRRAPEPPMPDAAEPSKKP
ncbi:MAG: hypothetical protein ABI175_29630 [Polyangiales bacterium]